MSFNNNMLSSTNPFSSWIHSLDENTFKWEYIIAISLIIIAFCIKSWIQAKINRQITHLKKKPNTECQKEILLSIRLPMSALVLLIGAYLAVWSLQIDLPEKLHRFSNTAFLIAFWIVIIVMIYRLLGALSLYLEKRFVDEYHYMDRNFIPMIRRGMRILTLLLGAVTLLSCLEVDVKGVLAGLGIGGLAVALAAQDTLGNFFGSVALLTDRPFKIGDWVKVSDSEGIVEMIGFRSTRIRSFEDSLISIPNKLLATQVINNYSEMHKRKVDQIIGISSKTPLDQVKALIQKIADELARNTQEIHASSITIRLVEIDKISFQILVRYCTKPVATDVYLAIKEKSNLAIIQIIQEMKISFSPLYLTHTDLGAL